MIGSVSQNHQGRRLDLALFPWATGPGQTRMDLSGTHGRAVAGPSKAAQNWVRLLMTPLGTWRSTPEAGSNFPAKFIAGAPLTFDQIPSLFAVEAMDVIEFMHASAPDAPDDEWIVSASLADYRVSPGAIALRIEMSFASGDKTEFLLPVETGGMLNLS